MSEDTGEAVLIRVNPGSGQQIWEPDTSPRTATWVILTGSRQAKVRSDGVIDLAGVCSDIEQAESDGEALLSGRVSSNGFLLPLESSEEVGLAMQAAQAYGW
jgi:hypothetical protein